MLLIAHRGLSQIYPENTLLAFQKALEYGATAIELDVRPTADNHFVILHDGNTKRISNKNLQVRKAPLSKISEVEVRYTEKFGNSFRGEYIITLQEFIEKFKNRCLLIVELKGAFSRELIEKLLKVVNAYDKGLLILSSKNINNLVLLREAGFDGNIAFIYEGGGLDWKTFDKLNLYSLHIKKSKLTRYLLKKIREKGYYLYVWTVDTPYEIRKMARLGVDGIFTNNIVLAKMVLDSIKFYVHHIPPIIAKRFTMSMQNFAAVRRRQLGK